MALIFRGSLFSNSDAFASNEIFETPPTERH